ncbi:fimbrial outer membrane usher protein [Proteus mirabilis]|uniref:Fimbrial outer membrane usher protein n=1 Tax=Proteus mirabilis TaxID=584 RepID=A0A379FHZ0_PROMI|nr:fimbrial outer membrane usher protein [Proteus mirabilis]
MNNRKIKVIPNIDIFQQPFHAICLPKNILELLDLKDSSKKLVNYYDSNQCIDLSNLTGSQMNIDLSSLSLKLTIPQYWLEYQDSYWVPPAHWEEGINGAFIDYSANVLATEYANNDKQIYLSTNGTAGINLGAWRFRGDYRCDLSKK